MSIESPTPMKTLAGLVERLGGVPLDRIRCQPPPGSGTVDDVLHIAEKENRLCELVEGVLVEKARGFRESILAMAIGQMIREFTIPANLGLVAGSDGMMQLFEGLVRIPDVSFVSWQNVPGGKVPEHPVPLLAPDLAVEVLSRTNTLEEMKRKRDEYFSAGSKLIWEVNHHTRTIAVYSNPSSPHDFTNFVENESLDGGNVLPGFSLSLSDLFAELDRAAG